MVYVPLEHWKAKEKETDTEKAPQLQPNVSPKSSVATAAVTHNTLLLSTWIRLRKATLGHGHDCGLDLTYTQTFEQF